MLAQSGSVLRRDLAVRVTKSSSSIRLEKRVFATVSLSRHQVITFPNVNKIKRERLRGCVRLFAGIVVQLGLQMAPSKSASSSSHGPALWLRQPRFDSWCGCAAVSEDWETRSTVHAWYAGRVCVAAFNFLHTSTAFLTFVIHVSHTRFH